MKAVMARRLSTSHAAVGQTSMMPICTSWVHASHADLNFSLENRVKLLRFFPPPPLPVACVTSCSVNPPSIEMALLVRRRYLVLHYERHVAERKRDVILEDEPVEGFVLPDTLFLAC